MKIFFFNIEKELINTLEQIPNPRIYGTDEIIWDEGGMGEINHHYVIVEDDVKFENLTDEEILEQYKKQAQFDIARNFENNKIAYMVEGTLEQEQQKLQENLQKVNELTTRFEVRRFLEEQL